MYGICNVVLLPPELYGGSNPYGKKFTVLDSDKAVEVEDYSYFRKSDGRTTSSKQRYHIVQTGETYIVTVRLKAKKGYCFSLGQRNSNNLRAPDAEVKLADGTKVSPCYGTFNGTETSYEYIYTMIVPKQEPYLRVFSANEKQGKIACSFMSGQAGSIASRRTAGEKVTLTAVPKNGYSFLGWYRNYLPYDAKNKSITIKKNDAIEVFEARFACYEYKCYSSNEKYGKTSVSGRVACEVGSKVKVSAIPESGYTFLGWYTNGKVLNTTKTELTFEKTAGYQEFEARFARYMLEGFANDPKCGAVYFNGTVKKGAFPCVKGAKLDMFVTPCDNDVSFLGWLRNGVEYESKKKVLKIVKSDCDEVFEARLAYFTMKCTSSNESYGKALYNNVRRSGSFYCAAGTKATLKAEWGAGITFLGWYRNGVLYSQKSSITIEKEACNEEYVAKYGYYTLSCDSNNKSYGTTNYDGTYLIESGKKVKLIATPKGRYKFLGWRKDNGTIYTSREITVEKEGYGEKYVAYFGRYTFKITDASTCKAVHPEVVVDFKAGSEITLKADAIPCLQRGYYFDPYWERKLKDGKWEFFSNEYKVKVTKAACDEEIRFSYKKVKE